PTHKYIFYPGMPGVDATTKITPRDDYGFKANNVSYPFPGAQLSEVSVAVTQLAGANILSKHSAREKHPFVDDPDQEEDFIAMEAIEAAVQAGFQQQAASGQIPGGL